MQVGLVGAKSGQLTRCRVHRLEEPQRPLPVGESDIEVHILGPFVAQTPVGDGARLNVNPPPAQVMEIPSDGMGRGIASPYIQVTPKPCVREQSSNQNVFPILGIGDHGHGVSPSSARWRFSLG